MGKPLRSLTVEQAREQGVLPPKVNNVGRLGHPDSVGAVRKPIARAVEADRLPGANKGERAYAAHLDAKKRAGEIVDWLFQPWKFTLAFKCGLEIDFLVINNDGTLEAVDVKGRKKNGYWCEEDAKIKLKVAARVHWWLTWAIAWPSQNGFWNREEL